MGVQSARTLPSVCIDRLQPLRFGYTCAMGIRIDPLKHTKYTSYAVYVVICSAQMESGFGMEVNGSHLHQLRPLL